jgi:hypothetical protein
MSLLHGVLTSLKQFSVGIFPVLVCVDEFGLIRVNTEGLTQTRLKHSSACGDNTRVLRGDSPFCAAAFLLRSQATNPLSIYKRCGCNLGCA